MNTFTKLLLTTNFIIGSYTFAQEHGDVNHNNKTQSSSLDNIFSFDGDWKISNDPVNNVFIITGNKITNNSKKNNNSLYLNLYFIPTNSVVNLNNLTNKVDKDFFLGKIEDKNTSLKNIYISFKNSDIKNFKNDNYQPLIVLKEQETNKILTYKALNDKVILNNDKIVLDNNDKIVLDNNDKIVLDNNDKIALDNNIESQISSPINSEIYNPKLFDKYTTVESSLALENINNNLNFEGLWQLSIDFEKLLIDVNGKNNSIINSNSKPTNDLKLLIYFSKENIKDSKSVNGYELANIDIPVINGKTLVQNPTYQTNITKLLPPGEYYPILAIVEKKENGEYSIKSTRALGDKYVWR